MATKTPMTVGAVMAELAKHPPEALVWTEGCDCYGDVVGIEPGHDRETSAPTVLLRRGRRVG